MMELISIMVDFVLHVDDHLNAIVREYGAWTYAILFLIIFCETGLVVTPFLPGDSLLFAAGALAAGGEGGLNPYFLFALLSLAAILGDSANYWIGTLLGRRCYEGRVRFIKPSHLDRTNAFYEKYGGKTIVIARFIPIVRTYAPFVAGAAKMDYSRFAFFNVSGALLWISLFVFGGYWFGNIPIVQDNFGLVVIGIIVLSILPPVIEYFLSRRRAARAAREQRSDGVVE
jgi:membrane-associated protein